MTTMTDQQYAAVQRAYAAGQKAALEHAARHFRGDQRWRLSGVGDLVAEELERFVGDVDEE